MAKFPSRFALASCSVAIVLWSSAIRSRAMDTPPDPSPATPQECDGIEMHYDYPAGSLTAGGTSQGRALINVGKSLGVLMQGVLPPCDFCEDDNRCDRDWTYELTNENTTYEYNANTMLWYATTSWSGATVAQRCNYCD